jgi:ABC-type glycerol-3-phosphate transport system substrate-binding protein
MIDETFTPEKGINVNLQLIPEDAVLKAALAGNGPDVVLGLKQATLQDFAMRDAILDLSKLKGFDEATSKYYDSVIDAASYQDGVYGMPEQADFFMLFNRKDILDKIGVKPPKTWDEVKEILPILAKSNYEFFIPTAQNAPNLSPSLYSLKSL